MAHYLLKSGEQITVDDHILPKMEGYTWALRPNGQVSAIYWNKETKKTTQLSLHNLILGKAPLGQVRTHKDGDALNFLTDNIVTVPNGKHSTGISGLNDLERRSAAIERSGKKYTGVSKKGNRFQAVIRRDGQQVNLGSFVDEKDAARAYDDELVKLGYGPVNFPESA